MTNLITSLQHEGAAQTKALSAIQNIFQFVKEYHPRLSSFSLSLLIKECLEEINSDELKMIA
jgi:hypothetical protein